MIENVKTVVLWVMILTSITLTFLVWTYQPDLEPLDETDDVYIDIENLGETRTNLELLMPREVIAHDRNSEAMYWIHPTNDRYEELMVRLSNIELEMMTEMGATNAPSLEGSMRGIELVFETAIDGDWLQEIFQIDEEDIMIDSVDRIIVRETPSANTDVLIQFIDYTNETVFESNTELSSTQLQNFYDGTEQFRTPVEKRVFQPNGASSFEEINYVTTESFSMPVLTYGSTSLPITSFIQTLFSNPDYVNQYFQANQENLYTDGYRVMNMSENNSILTYIRPDISSSNPITNSILQASSEFVNGHFGWTDDYYAMEWSESGMTDHITYRLHVDGMPVMDANTNQTGHYSIEIVRSGSQITEYTRPMFQLEDEPLMNVDSRETIPAFSDLEEQIEQNEPFSIEEVEDIRVGLEMNRQNSYAFFTPSWFVKVGGAWLPIGIPEDRERQVFNDGLE